MKTSRSEHGGVISALLITVAVLACVAVVVGLTIARNIHIDTTRSEDGKNLSVNTPAGSFTMHAQNHTGMEMVDVPRYPGARESGKGGGAEFQWTSNDGHDDKDFAVAGAEMITDDSASKVLDYYHERLPAWIVTHGRDGQISLKEPKEGGDSQRFIVIREKFDGTHIGVASIGAPAAN
jgi:hypothetical protein